MPYKKAVIAIAIFAVLLIFRIIPIASENGMWREFFVTATYLLITGIGVALLIAPAGMKKSDLFGALWKK